MFLASKGSKNAELMYLFILGMVIAGDGARQLSVPGHFDSLDESRVRDYCGCSRCGWGLFGFFLSSIISLFFLILTGRRPDIH